MRETRAVVTLSIVKFEACLPKPMVVRTPGELLADTPGSRHGD
jgi:hypothetical protein